MSLTRVIICFSTKMSFIEEMCEYIEEKNIFSATEKKSNLREKTTVSKFFFKASSFSLFRPNCKAFINAFFL